MGYTIDIAVIFRQLMVLFLTLGIGYGAVKLRAIPTSFPAGLSELILRITLPCMMIASALNAESHMSLAETAQVFLCCLIFYPVGAGVGWLVAKLLRFPRQDHGLVAYMMTFANVGFMGFPVMDAIFGRSALVYTVIANIVFNVMNFTLGLFLMRRSRRPGTEADLQIQAAQDWRARYAWLKKPGVVASVLSLILYVLAPKVPTVALETLHLVGGATTPLAMLFIGMSLARIRVRDVFTEWRMYPLAAIKAIGLPLLMLLIYRLFLPAGLLPASMVALIGMPIATTAVLFAEDQDANLPLATKGTFLTTMLSVGTMPLLLWLVGQLM